MKKSLGVLLLVAQTCASSQLFADSCDCKVTSHTFFSVRPQYQSASPERVSLFHDPMMRENGHGGTMQFVLFGGRSTHEKDLARFFTPFCKESLLVLEDPAGGTPDLLAQNFNITTVNGNFESSIKLKPRQSVFGLGFTYRQNLGNWFSCFEDCEHPWWFEISSPLMRVQNRVDLEETVTNDGGGVATINGLPEDQVLVANMTAAFNQTAWKYGKINDNDKMRKTRLADIEFKVGYEWVNTDCCGIESWIGLHIPTGNRPDAEFLFEPIVGANKHWGIMWGGSAYFKVWENDSWCIDFYVDSSSKYLFKRSELRSFDLKYRPWSRYVEVYANFEQAQQAQALIGTNLPAAVTLASPGINFLTQELQVKPGFSFTCNAALDFKSECWNLEAGLNLFARQAECVKLDDAFKGGFAIKAPTGQGATLPIRTINNNFLAANVVAFGQANFENSLVKESDLDLESAAHPAVITHTVYGALGYRFEDYCYPMFLGAGASYEFSRDNAGMNRWLLWGKFGFSF